MLILMLMFVLMFMLMGYYILVATLFSFHVETLVDVRHNKPSCSMCPPPMYVRRQLEGEILNQVLVQETLFMSSLASSMADTSTLASKSVVGPEPLGWARMGCRLPLGPSPMCGWGPYHAGSDP